MLDDEIIWHRGGPRKTHPLCHRGRPHIFSGGIFSVMFLICVVFRRARKVDLSRLPDFGSPLLLLSANILVSSALWARLSII